MEVGAGTPYGSQAREKNVWLRLAFTVLSALMLPATTSLRFTGGRAGCIDDADGGARKSEQNHWFPGHDFPSTCPRSDRLPTGKDPLGDIGYLIR